AHERGEDPAQDEHHRDRHEIEKGDPLVIGREEPGLHAVADVQVVGPGATRNPFTRALVGANAVVRRAGHGARSCLSRGGGRFAAVLVGAPGAVVVPGDAIVAAAWIVMGPDGAVGGRPVCRSDFTYSMISRIPSSVTSPRKVGITGWYPATIFADGS